MMRDQALSTIRMKEKSTKNVEDIFRLLPTFHQEILECDIGALVMEKYRVSQKKWPDFTMSYL